MGFEWKDVMLTLPVSATARDAVYELGCALEAVALWKMARAAQLCADSRQGTPGDAVSQVGGRCCRLILRMQRQPRSGCMQDVAWKLRELSTVLSGTASLERVGRTSRVHRGLDLAWPLSPETGHLQWYRGWRIVVEDWLGRGHGISKS